MGDKGRARIATCAGNGSVLTSVRYKGQGGTDGEKACVSRFIAPSDLLQISKGQHAV